MAAYDYGPIAETALRLITRFGTTAIVKKTEGGSTNPVTGAVTAGISTETTVRIIVQQFKAKDIDGTRIKQGDRLFLMQGTITEASDWWEFFYDYPGTPELSAKILFQNEEWNVMAVDNVAPNGESIVVRAHVRR